MIKIILKVPKGIAAVSADPVHPQLVSKINSMDLTAVCGAALKGFSKSVKYLLPLSGYSIHEERKARQMELEYAVRSNRSAILRAIYENHQYYFNAPKVIIMKGSNIPLKTSNKCDKKTVTTRKECRIIVFKRNVSVMERVLCCVFVYDINLSIG